MPGGVAGVQPIMAAPYADFRSHLLRLVESGYVADFTSPADQPLRMAPSSVAG